MKVGFIGSGNMANAIILGMSKDDKYQINVMDINEEALNKVKDKVSFTSINPIEVIERSDYLILAIKPNVYQKFLIENKDYLKGKIVVCIAAGISAKFMSEYVDNFVLVMPNTPAAVGLGLTSIVKNDSIDKKDFHNVVDIFKSVGEVEIISEGDMETLICLAGSSPAYFYLVLEAMAKFGVSKGIDEKKATKVAANVMNATAKMVLENESTPRQLANMVCSPNGTTIEAVNYFDDNNLEEIFYNAMEACFTRAKQMKRDNDELL